MCTVAAGFFAQGRLRRVVCNSDHLLGWDGMGWAAGRRVGCSVLLACIAARCVALGEGRADHRGPDCASNSSCRAQASGVLQHPLGILNVGTRVPLDGSRAGCTHVTGALAGCFPSGRCGASRGLLPAVDGVALYINACAGEGSLL